MDTPDEAAGNSSRTAAIVVAVFVVLALVVVAVLKVGSSSDEQVPWAIVQSADNGDALQIAPLVALTACTGQPKVDVRKSNANRVELAVSVKGGCEGESEGARPAKPIDVKLAQPLRGQQITGAKLQPPSAWPGAGRHSQKPEAMRAIDPDALIGIPSVVGFRFPDAKAILAAHEVEIAGVVGPTADATEVTSQAPRAGSTGSNQEGFTASVRLRTVPR